MAVYLNGFNEHTATFTAESTVVKGATVALSANNKVSLAASGAKFAGVAVNAREGLAGVLLCGYTAVKYTGSTAPSVGYNMLSADGTGGVKVDATGGRSILVTSVDTTAKTAGIIL